jgi:hypothetical protein
VVGFGRCLAIFALCQRLQDFLSFQPMVEIEDTTPRITLGGDDRTHIMFAVHCRFFIGRKPPGVGAGITADWDRIM